MPGPRLPMRKIRDVLRLSAAGMSKRQIAASLGVSATAAGECIRRARRAGLGWPLPEGLTDASAGGPALPAAARGGGQGSVGRSRTGRRSTASCAGQGVTLQLLWEEHRAVHPDGYGYSRFCELYRAWEARLSPTMRQSHVAGERMFVDYAGTTLEVIEPSTGEVMTAQLFVAVLGASNYTYAEATWTQGLVRLDRLAHARLRVLRRGSGDGGVRQSALGHHQSLLLRAGGQSHLCRDGGALRHRHRAGAAAPGRATRRRSRLPCKSRLASSSPSCATDSSSRSPS